ncbi:HAD family phosphatase [bacterium]|nr:HAD family phosphatase [bacterium]NUN44104.1 HAD family phosphatase [bacterium]
MSNLRLQEFSAVLFDFDGVLMDSIGDHHRSWNSVFSEYGVSINWDEFCLLEGQSLFVIAEQLCMNHGVDIKYGQEIGKKKNNLYLNTAKPKLYDGAEDLIEWFRKQGLKTGLVTGAHRDRFYKTVGPDFTKRFEVIITADDVMKTKPDPEPYTTAATRLSVSPERCIVIENAPLGVTAAKKAKMACIALTTTLDQKYLNEADVVIPDLFSLKVMAHAAFS